MAQIGTLTTGATVQTIFNLDDVPEYVLVGDTVTDLPLTGFAVSIKGNQTMNIIGQPILQAYSKWKMEGALGASVKVAQLLRVTDGGTKAKCQLVLTNAGATTPGVFAFSKREASGVSMGMNFTGLAIKAGMQGLNATSQMTFNNFLALFFVSTNLDSAQIQWYNRANKRYWMNKLTAVELAAMFAIDNEADASGLLAAQICIDNSRILLSDQNIDDPNVISELTLYTTAGGTMSVLNVSADTY